MKNTTFIPMSLLLFFLYSCTEKVDQEASKEMSLDEYLVEIGVDDEKHREAVQVLLDVYEKESNASGARLSKGQYAEEFKSNLNQAHQSIEKHIKPLAYELPIEELWRKTDSVYLSHRIPVEFVDHLRKKRSETKSN
jgi:hypothetical protein